MCSAQAPSPAPAWHNCPALALEGELQNHFNLSLVHSATDTSPRKRGENYFLTHGGDFLVAEVPWDSGGAGVADAQKMPRAREGCSLGQG